MCRVLNYYIKTFTIFILLISCKKEEKKYDPTTDVITYEVRLENATSWHGVYFNENAQAVDVTDAVSGWKYTFINKNLFIAPTILGYPDGTNINQDCVMTIKVNDVVVANGRSSISPQVQYVFP